MSKSKKNVKVQVKPVVEAVKEPRDPKTINAEYGQLAMALGETIYRQDQAVKEIAALKTRIDNLGEEMRFAAPYHQAKAQAAEAKTKADAAKTALNNAQGGAALTGQAN